RALLRMVCWNSSATASLIGNTVLEPSTLITAFSAARVDRAGDPSTKQNMRKCFIIRPTSVVSPYKIRLFSYDCPTAALQERCRDVNPALHGKRVGKCKEVCESPCCSDHAA